MAHTPDLTIALGHMLTSSPYKLSNIYSKGITLDKSKMRSEQVNSAITNYLAIAIANTLASLLLYFALKTQNTNVVHLNIWLTSQVLLGVVWITIYLCYTRNLKITLSLWDKYTDTPLGLWSGLGWGLSWAIFIDPNNLQSAFFLNTAICGIVLAIVVCNPLDQQAMLATLLPCLLPVIAKSLWIGGVLFNWIALIALLFLGTAFGLSKILQHLYFSMFKERELSKQLVIKLEKEKEKVEALHQEKTQLIAAASHDLRQPIQAIRLYEGLLTASSRDENQKALLQKISDANDSLGNFMEALLELYKLDSGTVSVQPEPVILNELFDQIYEQYVDQAIEKDIQLVVMPTSRLTPYIDPIHLQRILNNLVSNAIQHMGRPGKILLGARQLSGETRVEVYDNGTGISKDQQAAVFNEFHQINNQNRDKNEGLGLGLAIAKRLAEVNGCKIDLKSTPDKGCCFRLHFPTPT